MEEKIFSEMILRCKNGHIDIASGYVVREMVDICETECFYGGIPDNGKLRNYMGLADFCYETRHLRIAAYYYMNVRDMALEYCYDMRSCRYFDLARTAESKMEKILGIIAPDGRYVDLFEDIEDYVMDLRCIYHGE